jgi:hypothetical protein
MAEDSTGVSGGKVSPLYRPGDTIVFKYEGNVRAEVTGHQIVGGKVWLEARAAELTFLIPAHAVVGTEPKEVA